MKAVEEKGTAVDRAALTESIKARAFEFGFDKVGIVRAESLTEERARLEEWLRRGHHGEMPYMTRDPEQRSNPRKIFAGAKSVIVVALNYYTAHEHEVRTACVSGRVNVRSKATGKVSRYAWGDDYHEIVCEKLRDLLAWIQAEYPEAEGKVCVDIQPMMDKADRKSVV